METVSSGGGLTRHDAALQRLLDDIETMERFARTRGVELPDTLQAKLVELYSLPETQWRGGRNER